MKEDTEKTFILTDLCMWEQNKQDETKNPHAVIVVDEETGQTRHILSGSKIKFVSGEMSEPLSQEDYNQQEL